MVGRHCSDQKGQLVWVMGTPWDSATERFIHTGPPNTPSLKSQRRAGLCNMNFLNLYFPCAKNTSQVSSCKHPPCLLFEEQSSLLNTFKAKLFSCLKHKSYHVILSLQSVSHLRAFACAIPFPPPALAQLVSSHPSGLTYSERPCLTIPTQSCSWPLNLYLYTLFLVKLLL